MYRSLFLRLLALACLFPLISSDEVDAQVLVYELDFKDDSDAINYRPYYKGFYVAPATGGQGSLLLQRAERNGQRLYVPLQDFGELFTAVDGKKKRMVLSAMATNDISATAFLAMGKLDESFEIEGDNFTTKVQVAKKLRGTTLSADSQSDLPFYGLGEDSGVAGISEFSAELDRRRSEEAIEAASDVATVFAELVSLVEGQGYTSASSGENTDTETDTDTDQTGDDTTDGETENATDSEMTDDQIEAALQGFETDAGETTPATDATLFGGRQVSGLTTSSPDTTTARFSGRATSTTPTTGGTFVPVADPFAEALDPTGASFRASGGDAVADALDPTRR